MHNFCIVAFLAFISYGPFSISKARVSLILVSGVERMQIITGLAEWREEFNLMLVIPRDPWVHVLKVKNIINILI